LVLTRHASRAVTWVERAPVRRTRTESVVLPHPVRGSNRPDMEDGRPRPSGNGLGTTGGTPVLHRQIRRAMDLRKLRMTPSNPLCFRMTGCSAFAGIQREADMRAPSSVHSDCETRRRLPFVVAIHGSVWNQTKKLWGAADQSQVCMGIGSCVRRPKDRSELSRAPRAKLCRHAAFYVLTKPWFGYNPLSKKSAPSVIQAQQSG
jgi:hypothetical protein